MGEVSDVLSSWASLTCCLKDDGEPTGDCILDTCLDFRATGPHSTIGYPGSCGHWLSEYHLPEILGSDRARKVIDVDDLDVYAVSVEAEHE